MNPRPLGYEPNELPDCSTPRQKNISLSRALTGQRLFLTPSPLHSQLMQNGKPDRKVETLAPSMQPKSLCGAKFSSRI